MRFSERYGFKKVRESFQHDSVDAPLRNGLWNLLSRCYWSMTKRPAGYAYVPINSEENFFLRELCCNIIENYFKAPLDEMNADFKHIREMFKYHILHCEWFEVYDFIEFIAKIGPSDEVNTRFQKSCNKLLEREMSAYRFIKGEIAPITDNTEIESIEHALEIGNSPVREHLNKALSYLSDREKPDYKNSIKESISAVESMASQIVGDKPELGQLLKKIDESIPLHPTLKKAFQILYGYTSNEGGIRHASIEDTDSIDFYDAKFMLVACSTFINYVNGKLEQI